MSHSNRLICALALAAALVGCAADAGPAPDDKAASGGAGGVAATVGDKTISLAEVDARAAKTNLQTYQALYDTRRQTLDQMIVEIVLGEQAEAAGVSEQEFLAKEIATRTPEVTDDEIQAFYTENQARMQGQTLEQISPQIKSFLERQAAQKVQADFISELKKKSGVEYAIDPPRMEVQIADNDPYMGGKDAEVVIVEYSDFQ